MEEENQNWPRNFYSNLVDCGLQQLVRLFQRNRMFECALIIAKLCVRSCARTRARVCVCASEQN